MNQNPQQPLIGMIFTDADPRYAGRLDDKQGGDNIVTMERVNNSHFHSGADRQVNMVVAHIGANVHPLETVRRKRAGGESIGFRQQPKCTWLFSCA